MKKVMIYDCAAESGGALTVLNQYHKKFFDNEKVLSYFVISLADLEENEHCKTIKIPWIKKSRIHRLFFDYFCVQKIIDKLQPDEIISLQNIGIPRCKIHQTVLVHNVIPFSDVKCSFFNERKLWISQNIIGFFTLRSLKRVDKIVVQTEWMKKAVCEKCGIDSNKVLVQKMKSSFEQKYNRIYTEKCRFFYPATPVSYKNHHVVIKACERLNNVGIEDYEVVFTFRQGDSDLADKIYSVAKEKNLPIVFSGQLDRAGMEENYMKSTLLFPSYLETVGLPLLEAQSFNCDILVSDCEYAHDALEGYSNCKFFSKEDSIELYRLMKEAIAVHTHCKKYLEEGKTV